MQVTTKLQKWGNSTAIRIPKKVLDDLKLKAGQEMVVHAHQDGLLLKPNTDDKKMTLADLLRDATPEKVGGELNWGPDRGMEILDD